MFAPSRISLFSDVLLVFGRSKEQLMRMHEVESGLSSTIAKIDGLNSRGNG
jgi:hypothetical protein